MWWMFHHIGREAIVMKFLPEFFDDWFQGPLFTKETACMKTDIHEQDGQYLLNMELPGYQKEDIQLELNDGYLQINAQHDQTDEEKDKNGSIVRRERHFGSCSRSFYVGDHVTQEDIKASYLHGELRISIPKKEETIATRTYIPIE